MIAIDEQSTVLQQFLFIPVEMKSATFLSAAPMIIPFAPNLAARICIWAVQFSIEAGGSQAKFLHEVASTTPRTRTLGFCKTVLSRKDFTLLIVWLSRACRVTELGDIGQRFQPKEHQVLVLG